MLKHLPRFGMDFLLHIFNLFWSSHSFPSIWKTSSIIPIHKMGKPLDSPASFRPISLNSCVSKLFECIIPSRLLFFVESNSILSPCQANFRPGQSTLDQILYLSQSISDGFNKPRTGSLTILSTINFSKAFDSVWHPALFHKLILAGLPPCFARWTQSFFSDRRASVVFQNHKSCSFRVRWGVPQGSVLGPVLFSLFINDLPASLPSSVSCSLYADNLAIWSSSPLVSTAVEATQGALFWLERWSEHWCLPLNPSKCEASFFSVDPHQANLQPNLLLLGSHLHFNPTPTFLGVTFDDTLSFSKHVSLLKAKFFPRLKALRCISASSWGPSKESLSLLYKSFLHSFLTYASPRWFPFLSTTNLTKLEYLHQVASPTITAASRCPISHFFSPRLLYLPFESPWLTSLFFLMRGLFVSQPLFLFQVWSDVEWNQDSTDRLGELLHSLTRSCFLLLVLGRLFLLALPFLLGICFHSEWSPPFPLHALALIPPLLPRCSSRPPPWLSSPSWSGALDRRLCSFSFR